MATTAMRGAVVKTMQYVPEKMVLATAPDQGGQGCCVIIPAVRDHMGSTVLTSACVKITQLVIERQVSLSYKRQTKVHKLQTEMHL